MYKTASDVADMVLVKSAKKDENASRGSLGGSMAMGAGIGAGFGTLLGPYGYPGGGSLSRRFDKMKGNRAFYARGAIGGAAGAGLAGLSHAALDAYTNSDGKYDKFPGSMLNGGLLSGGALGALAALDPNLAKKIPNDKLRILLGMAAGATIMAAGGALGAALGSKLTEKKGSDMYKTASDVADIVLMKLSAITDEEVARGLSGVPGRPDISRSEIQERGQQAYDQEYADQSSAPWVGGTLGALAGGATGGAIRGLPGAAVGALIGGAGGAGLGQLTRRGMAAGERDAEEGLGTVAQTGRIPNNVPSGHLLRYPYYATGVQQDRIDPEALERHREESRRAQRQQAMEQAMYGALRGNMLSNQEGDGQELRSTLTGAAAGGLRGMAEGRRAAGQQEELYERGYGHLADTLRRRQY